MTFSLSVPKLPNVQTQEVYWKLCDTSTRGNERQGSPWPKLLEPWLALTNVAYHGNLQVSIFLNHASSDRPLVLNYLPCPNLDYPVALYLCGFQSQWTLWWQVYKPTRPHIKQRLAKTRLNLLAHTKGVVWQTTSKHCTKKRTARAARLFFLIQPIKSMICGIVVDVAVVKS